MKLLNVSVIVVSDGNNPRIINPDFLERNGISDRDWTVENTIVIPPLGRVVYTNGVEVLLEEQKFKCQANEVSKFSWESRIPTMAIAFLKTLPHVVYRGCGLNFVFSANDKVRGKRGLPLLDHMIASGPWIKFGNEAHIETVKFQYKLDDSVLNLIINRQVESKNNGERNREIRFDVNFHKEFDPNETEKRQDYINTLSDRYKQVNSYLRRLPLVD